MLRVSLRNLVAHKLRFLLTIAAVTLGVGFVSGTFVLSDTMTKAFDELYGRLTATTDVAVRAESAYTDITTQGQTRPFDESVVDLVADVPGVEVAEGSVTGFALVLGEDGEPIQPGGAPTFGTSIGLDEELAGEFGIRQGRHPNGPEEMILDAKTASTGGYVLGEPVDIILESGQRTFTLVGIISYGDSESLAGATLSGFDLATAQQLFDKVGQLDGIAVRGAPGTDPEELRDDIAAVLPPGTEALTGTQVADEGSTAIREGLGAFTQILLVFAGVSLLVGAFVIWNTFAVTVAQRRREIALLRAVGATRRQVLGGIIIEAATIGLLAAGLGLGAGVGLAVGIRQLLKLIGLEMPTTAATIEPRTVLAAVSVGVIVTVVAAVAPALSATRVSPVEALRDGDPTTNAISRRRQAWGWTLLALGAAGMTAVALVGNQPWLTGASTLITFVGLVICGPTLAGMLAAVADRGRRGTARRMAARNIGRASRRAAATALALTIGLSVVAAVAVVAASLKDSVTEAVEAGNRSDFIVAPVAVTGGVSPEVAALLREDPDVETVVEFRQSGAMVAGEVVTVVGADPAGLASVLDLGVTEGSLHDFQPGSILLGNDQAASLNLDVGDEVSLVFPETGPTTVRVAAIFEDDLMIGSSYVLPMTDFQSHVTARVDTAVMLSLTADATPAGVEARLADLLEDYPNVEVSDPAERTEAARESVDQLLGLVTALLLLAVVVAVLGIMNTLALSVVERTRELGLLRAVGATRHQVAGVIRDESVLMAVLGAVTGLALGTGAGVAMSRALADEGISTVTLPATLLATYLVVAIIVGILAAIGPARRASRVDVLTAITVE